MPAPCGAFPHRSFPRMGAAECLGFAPGLGQSHFPQGASGICAGGAPQPCVPPSLALLGALPSSGLPGEPTAAAGISGGRARLQHPIKQSLTFHLPVPLPWLLCHPTPNTCPPPLGTRQPQGARGLQRSLPDGPWGPLCHQPLPCFVRASHGVVGAEVGGGLSLLGAGGVRRAAGDRTAPWPARVPGPVS